MLPEIQVLNFYTGHSNNVYEKKITLNIKYACALLYYKVYSTIVGSLAGCKSRLQGKKIHLFDKRNLIHRKWLIWLVLFRVKSFCHPNVCLTSKLGLQSSIVRLHQWFINSWLIFNDSSTFDANVHTQNIIKSKSVNSIDLFLFQVFQIEIFNANVQWTMFIRLWTSYV